jgi:hypothetical protein
MSGGGNRSMGKGKAGKDVVGIVNKVRTEGKRLVGKCKGERRKGKEFGWEV